MFVVPSRETYLEVVLGNNLYNMLVTICRIRFIDLSIYRQTDKQRRMDKRTDRRTDRQTLRGCLECVQFSSADVMINQLRFYIAIAYGHL